ncbi:glycerophosphodiester phosphodiesterase [Paenibacillus solani]|uniref:glycerophosphodiester phosphodiesterase n=1 Tax=Paenibacillus solani TaxID=1705565 RepID=UPI003D28C68A
MLKQQPLIIAHRGAKGEAPENTLAAFRLGMDQGCDAIELDIHLTLDRHIVVIHDATVDRTTTGSGEVDAMTLAELKKLDAGSWFSEAFAGEGIPTLAEVLELVPPEIMINIEMKGTPGETGLVKALEDLLREKQRIDSVVVSSFDHAALYKLKKLEPNLRIGLLYMKERLSPAIVKREALAEIYSLHPHHEWITPEYVAEALEQGWVLYPWTVNEEDQFREMLSAGVAGMITDYPGRLRRMLDHAKSPL